ncbi:MAG: glutathione S-transferase family protein [Alphaproteobacteria bacterium]
MSIEIFAFPLSPRAFKPLVVANYLELDYTLNVLDPRKGDFQKPEYAAINPNRRQPTLRDGDYVVWESNAIQQYLALQRPDSGLLPRDERARLDVTRWQFWDLAHWDPHAGAYTFEYVAKPQVLGIHEPDLAALAKAEELFHRSAKVLNAQLQGKNHVTGNTLTLADFTLAGALVHAETTKIPITPYPEICRWLASLQALPAWRKTVAQQKM